MDLKGAIINIIQIVQAFEEVNDIKIPYEIVYRRSVNISPCYADASKAKKRIREIGRDAWRFEMVFDFIRKNI